MIHRQQHNLEQRNIDNTGKTFGLEDEDIMAVCALLLGNILLHRILKPLIFDPFLGRLYDSIFLYFFQLLILMPLGMVLFLKVIKYKKTKGYLYNSLYLLDTQIGTYYDPFLQHQYLKKKEGFR